MEINKKENKREGRRIAWSLVLPVGEENAISAGELARRCNITDLRSLRYEVMSARLSGVPICSLSRSEKSGGGYFLGDKEKPEQIEHTVNEMRKRAFSSLKQAAILTRWKNGGNEFEQMTIGDFLRQAEEEARAIS